MIDRTIALIIPAYNEEYTISKIVEGAGNYGDVIVVNDASSDATSARAASAGAFVLNHSSNQGYESALNTGFHYATSHGYDYVITLDADGQHNPLLIEHFIQELEGGADLVVGRRSNLQRWSETIFSLFSRLLWGVSDPLCGMKAYRLSFLKEPKIFDSLSLIGTELMVRMIKGRARVAEVRVITTCRNGKSRFGDGIWINLKILRALARLLFAVR